MRVFLFILASVVTSGHGAEFASSTSFLFLDSPAAPDSPAPTAAPIEPKRTIAPYNMTTLKNWYNSDLPRGGVDTLGDYTGQPNYRSVKNSIPVRVRGGHKAIICSGAGCQVKVPFVFTSRHMKKVGLDMDRARTKAGCTSHTARCELFALRAAMVTMEVIVHNEKLRKISSREQRAYSVQDENAPGKAQLQDCVDQTTNGISYLYVLANNGLMNHHRIIEPGANAIHHWTRIENDSGQRFDFDLYHRGSYGIPPAVRCYQNCQAR